MNRLTKSNICRKQVTEVNSAQQRKQSIFKGTTEKPPILISTATYRLSIQTKDKYGRKVMQLHPLVYSSEPTVHFSLYLTLHKIHFVTGHLFQ
jgi:hypothetical protein